jgi:hypothetical protein
MSKLLSAVWGWKTCTSSMGIHHSGTNFTLVIARSAATRQSPGNQALNFRRLLRFARNDSHLGTSAKTMLFALVITSYAGFLF